MKKHIITTPNPILNRPTTKVDDFGDELKKTASEMLSVLRENADAGIGLAANQLGLDKSIFVVEFDDPDKKDSIPLQFFVNPEIVESSKDQETMEEGCLSVPNIFLPVERSKKIKVRAQNLKGKSFKLTTDGLFARLILHESDHLKGKIFTSLVREKLINENPEIKKLKIIYIGSGEFSEIIYRGLVLAGFNIVLTITDNIKTPVAISSTIFNKKLIATENINKNISDITDLNPDLIILADFGQILTRPILEIPRLAAINLHPSLLPKFRGPTPIQSAILSGDNKTGVTMIKMDSKIDTGKIIIRHAFEIKNDDNAKILQIKLANIALRLIFEEVGSLISGDFKEIKQDNSKATYTHKFKKEDGEIDWKKNPIEIERQIRALYPWPGSYTFINGKRLIIQKAHLFDKKLVLDTVQQEGKRVMLFKDFLIGQRGAKPAWFSKIRLEKKSKIN